MSKHGKLVNVLHKIYLLEYKTRSFKEIDKQIEYYEKRNLELVSAWPHGRMPEHAQKEINDTAIKIKALKWTIYDD
jgi:hypothetical protein